MPSWVSVAFERSRVEMHQVLERRRHPYQRLEQGRDARNGDRQQTPERIRSHNATSPFAEQTKEPLQPGNGNQSMSRQQVRGKQKHDV